MKKILVIGSISIDNVTYTSVLPEPGTTVYGESFLSNIGGKGANQACAIHFLNGDTSLGKEWSEEQIEKLISNIGEPLLHYELNRLFLQWKGFNNVKDQRSLIESLAKELGGNVQW